MKIIAHKIININQAKKAFAAGVDFIEVDVAKRVIFSKFTTQHHGVLGKFGIGESLEPLLSSPFANKLLLDIKHASYSLSFTSKFSQLLTDHNLKNIRICGLDWPIISTICRQNKCLPFYSLVDKKDLIRIKKLLPKLTKPEGFSVNHMLIDKNLIDYCSRLKVENYKLLTSTRLTGLRSKNKMAGFEILAWTVNDLEEKMRLEKLGIDGIITDEWKKFTNL